MPAFILTPDQVSRIKARLWFGETCEAVGAEYNISTSQLLSIRSGKRWPDVQWPDGSTGRMSKKRTIAIAKARRQASQKIPNEVVKILKQQDAAAT